VPAIPKVLVIGGGIAGMQASLDVANAGYQIYLVERYPWIGGHMSQFDKTFPTNDCAMCTISPKLTEVGQHPAIELITNAEVKEVRGEAGAFHVRVLQRPRYIDEGKCTACGQCAEACRLKDTVVDDFNMGLGSRSACYLAYPQAIPVTYAIDPDHCLMVTRGKCGTMPKCIEACDRQAINFEQQEGSVELEVGAIIVAVGYEVFDPRLKPEYGYGKYRGVITSLEMERLFSPSGPTEGEIIIDGKVPKRFVFIQCVGSRDQTVGNPYCSRVCCMYTAKHAYGIRDRVPEAQVTVCFTDVRAFGKGHEGFHERVQRSGVVYRRGLPSEVSARNGDLVVRGEDTLLNRPYEDEADVVVLACGLRPPRGMKEIAAILDLAVDENGFLKEQNPHDPVVSGRSGVFFAGCCESPKDITDSVSQASGAAAKALAVISKVHG
jgi:heterodisulfide reductase subunit A